MTTPIDSRPAHPTRRGFLQGACALPFATVDLRAPFDAPVPFDAAAPFAHWLPGGDDRFLCVIELIGGNDGLNTLIPLDDDAYGKARPRLSAVRKGAHRVGDGFGLHPALGALARRMQGQAAAVHSVGYDRPDRSHFRSRDIWHAADPGLQRVQADTTGWLGRAADALAVRGAGMPAAALGGERLPLLLQAANVVVPTLERVEDFALLAPFGDGAGARKAAAVDDEPPARESLRDFVAATAARAVAMVDRLQANLQRYRPAVDYPGTTLGNELQLAARMAISGFGTRLFHVGLPGFDTHARQLPTQQGLLQDLDAALEAFLADLGAQGLLERTVVFVHSEFGRRVAENQSQGTDHGAAAPVFVAGGSVRPGLHGAPPDLDDRLDGDVRPTTDFRVVYGELLRWLGIDDVAVLGARYDPIGLLR